MSDKAGMWFVLTLLTVMLWIFTVGFAFDLHRATVIKACGKCENFGAICGKFVCTEEGWD